MLASGVRWRFGLAGLQQMVVDHAAPVGCFVRRQFVAEHVEPAAAHLMVDTALAHPLQSLFRIAQARCYRPRRLAAGKRKLEAAIALQQFDRRKLPDTALQVLEHGLRGEMGVDVDVHADALL